MPHLPSLLLASLLAALPTTAALANHHEHDDGTVRDSATDRAGRESDSVREDLQRDRTQEALPQSDVGTGTGTADREGRDSEAHRGTATEPARTAGDDQAPGRGSDRH